MKRASDAHPLALAVLPGDVLWLILRMCAPPARCALYAVNRRLREIASQPIMTRLQLSMRHTVRSRPTEKYARTEWGADLPCLSRVLRDQRLARVRALIITFDGPSFAPTSRQSERAARALAPRLPLPVATEALKTLKLECDPRVCAAPSASLMRRLIPSFAATLASLTLHNMFNVGVSHFVAINACSRLRVLHFRRCRLAASLSNDRRSVDGTEIAKCVLLQILTLDLLNADSAVAAACRSGGVLRMQPMLKHADLGARSFAPLAEAAFALEFLRAHPHLVHLRIGRATAHTIVQLQLAGYTFPCPLPSLELA